MHQHRLFILLLHECINPFSFYSSFYAFFNLHFSSFHLIYSHLFLYSSIPRFLDPRLLKILIRLMPFADTSIEVTKELKILPTHAMNSVKKLFI